MAKAVHAIPPGYGGAIPYLIVDGGLAALAFYAAAFGAETLEHAPGPDGKLMHAEMRIGTALFMLADAFPEQGFKGPTSYGGSPVSLVVYVHDVDAAAARAVAAGIQVLRPVKDQFYGDRSGTFRDPFGHTWTLSTHKEDLTGEEIARRAAAAHG